MARPGGNGTRSDGNLTRPVYISSRNAIRSRQRKGPRVYRLFALVFVFAAAACGGGGAGSETPTPAAPTATHTATQNVAGDRTATPSTPTAEATPPGTYAVAEGDTLWDIALKFNTTVEALVAANGLANADELTVGQLLKISAAAVVTGTPSATTTTVSPSPTQ